VVTLKASMGTLNSPWHETPDDGEERVTRGRISPWKVRKALVDEADHDNGEGKRSWAARITLELARKTGVRPSSPPRTHRAPARRWLDLAHNSLKAHGVRAKSARTAAVRASREMIASM